MLLVTGTYKENVVRNKSMEDLDGSQSLDLGKVVKEKNHGKNGNRGSRNSIKKSEALGTKNN